MSTQILIILLKIVTLFVLFITMYFFIDFLRTRYYEKKIKKGMQQVDVKSLKNQMKNIQYSSKRKNIKYIENMNLLIEQSGINIKFKFVNAFLVVVISLILGFIFFFFSKKYMEVLFPSIILGVIGFQIPSIILNIMVSINSDKITKKLVDFINLLKNFCMIKNDISSAIAGSSEYLKEPLKNICETYTYEVKHGIAPYDALENAKEKIDNNQYKLLIKNLQICSKHSNEFLKVLKNSEGLILRFSKEQNLRKKEIKKGIGGILMLLFISMIIFFMLTKINENLLFLLKTTLIGKIIVSIIVFSYLIAILVCKKLSRFDF